MFHNIQDERYILCDDSTSIWTVDYAAIALRSHKTFGASVGLLRLIVTGMCVIIRLESYDISDDM